MIKTDLYRYIKIAGFLIFIPIVLVTGPLAGYLFGDFLIRQFKFSSIIVYILICLGFLASILEIVKIIKLSIRELK